VGGFELGGWDFPTDGGVNGRGGLSFLLIGKNYIVGGDWPGDEAAVCGEASGLVFESQISLVFDIACSRPSFDLASVALQIVDFLFEIALNLLLLG
jgi:hypothetical protein